MLPENINIGAKTINTIIVISVLGVFCWMFILWSESKKDGFNSDKFFDLIFTSAITSGISVFILYKIIEWVRIFHPSNLLLYFDQGSILVVTAFLMSIVPVILFASKHKWSVFRILDINSMAFSILLMIVGLGGFLISGQREYLILFFSLLVLYLLVMKYRGYKFMSGVIFSIFSFFMALSFIIYLRKDGYLLFSSILVTMGMLNLYLRGKKNMSKTILPENFISNIKNKLLSKEKRLSENQQSLIKDDPYLQQGRATDNAETLDDVMEDTRKIITDERLKSVRGLKVQVRKALAALKIGKYGKCEVCGKSIDKARLEVYPEATTCIDCATDHSQLEDIKEDEILEKNI